MRFFGTRCTSEIALVRFVRQKEHSGLDQSAYYVAIHAGRCCLTRRLNCVILTPQVDLDCVIQDSYREKLFSVFLTLQMTDNRPILWFFLIFCWFNTWKQTGKFAGFFPGVTAAKYLFNSPRAFNFPTSSFSLGTKHNIRAFMLGTITFSL